MVLVRGSATPTGPTYEWLDVAQLPVAEGATVSCTPSYDQVADVRELAWGRFGAVPAGPTPQLHVVVPRCWDLAMITAVTTQDNGEPEEVSATLAGRASQIVGPPAP